MLNSMVYAPHLRLSVGGSFMSSGGGPLEIWSNTYNFGLGAAAPYSVLPTPAQIEAFTADAALTTDVLNIYTGAGTAMCSGCRVDLIKWSAIDASGHVVGAVGYPGVGDTVGRGADAALHPSTTSLVLSMRTGLRGPGNRGRVFLPAPDVHVSDVTWQFNAIEAQGWFNKIDTFMATLVEDLTTAAAGVVGGQVARLVVASKSGTNVPVAHLEIDEVPANIRRRKNALAAVFYPA